MEQAQPNPLIWFRRLLHFSERNPRGDDFLWWRFDLVETQGAEPHPLEPLRVGQVGVIIRRLRHTERHLLREGIFCPLVAAAVKNVIHGDRVAGADFGIALQREKMIVNARNAHAEAVAWRNCFAAPDSTPRR